MNQEPTDVSAWIEATKKEWLFKQIKLECGAEEGAIDATEAVIGFIFPMEMRAMYLVVNGFKDWDWTKGMISLWPMERIQEEYQLYRDKNFVGFCDYLITPLWRERVIPGGQPFSCRKFGQISTLFLYLQDHCGWSAIKRSSRTLLATFCDKILVSRQCFRASGRKR